MIFHRIFISILQKQRDPFVSQHVCLHLVAELFLGLIGRQRIGEKLEGACWWMISYREQKAFHSAQHRGQRRILAGKVPFRVMMTDGCTGTGLPGFCCCLFRFGLISFRLIELGLTFLLVCMQVQCPLQLVSFLPALLTMYIEHQHFESQHFGFFVIRIHMLILNFFFHCAKCNHNTYLTRLWWS